MVFETIISIYLTYMNNCDINVLTIQTNEIVRLPPLTFQIKLKCKQLLLFVGRQGQGDLNNPSQVLNKTHIKKLQTPKTKAIIYYIKYIYAKRSKKHSKKAMYLAKKNENTLHYPHKPSRNALRIDTTLGGASRRLYVYSIGTQYGVHRFLESLDGLGVNFLIFKKILIKLQQI